MTWAQSWRSNSSASAWPLDGGILLDLRRQVEHRAVQSEREGVLSEPRANRAGDLGPSDRAFERAHASVW
jgi:hypothetical protein